MIKLTGLSAFPLTPADRGGNVIEADLRKLLAPLVAAGVDSIGLLGSTGNYVYLSRERRRKAIETALREVNGAVPVLVGVGALRTDEAVRLAQDAKAAGADAGLLAPVSYTPLTDEEVFEHFRAVAAESGLPICIYDNPGTTHFRFSPELVGRLSRVDGIVAVKAPAPEPAAVAQHLAELRSAVKDGFPIGYSGDWNSVEALLAGADTWYSVLGGLMPEICVAMVRASQKGDFAEARRLNASLEPLWALFKEYSSLRVMFAVARMRGLTQAEPPRPILPLPAPAQRKVAEVVGLSEAA